jgi:N6-adenosine-specific RNA methylase IME4
MKKYHTLEDWKVVMIDLARQGRSNMFAAGDAWNDGRRDFGVGVCNSVVSKHGWKGYARDTLKTYGSIAARFPEGLRYLNADFSHYQTVAPLPNELAIPLLEQAIRERWTVNRLRIAKRVIHIDRSLIGGDVVADVATLIRDGKTFRGILADPPWRLYVTAGKRGASDAYYPSMSTEHIAALPVAKVATNDAFLFLWCPAAMLLDAPEVIARWGFAYKTAALWKKDKEFGTGSYFRMQHENLLLGVRPGSPTHFADRAISSVIDAPRTEHSRKPEEVHGIVERACGQGPFLELFSRRHMPGWTCCGNQLAPSSQPRQLIAAD